MYRPGKMMERYQRQHPGIPDSGGNLPVVLQHGGIELTRRGFNSRPGNRKSKNFASEVTRQADILGVSVPKIGRFSP
jgi:hypothetical protein